MISVKRLLFVMTALILVCAAVVMAIGDSDDSDASSTFTVDGINYETTSDSTVKVISKSYSGSVMIPSTVTYSYITYSVTSIGDRAFYQCTSLTSATIPDSVTSIGNNAFYGCYSLVEVCNDSSLPITKRSEDYGYVAYYALNLYSSDSGSSKLHYQTLDDPSIAVYYQDDSNTYLVKINDMKSIVTLPDTLGGESYGIYQYAFYNCTSLTSVTIGNSVTSIGNNAFQFCASMTSVTIPDSVTSIGTNAFRGCTSLIEINVSEGNSNYCSDGGVLFNKQKTLLIAFPVGISDKSYTIPDSVTSIGNYAFFQYTSLTSITIPNSVTSIGNSSFRGCTFLTSLTIPDSVISIGSYAFQYCTSLNSVDIGNGVTTIGKYAFNNCTSLNSVDIGNGVTTINEYAFSDCTSLTSLTIPGNVTTISNYAFENCTSLNSVDICNGVKSIGNFVFSDCTSLTSLTIPKSITSIGTAPFYPCTSLTEINVDEENSHYCSDGGVLFNKQKTFLIQYPAGKTDPSYDIPVTVKKIWNYAFYGCTSLTSVTIPKSVTAIGASVFSYCTSLTEFNVDEENSYYCSDGGVLFNKGKTQLISYPVGRDDQSYIIPDSVTILGVTTSVGDKIFSGCASLTSVTIPESVTTINKYTFQYCTSLIEINVSEGNSNYCSDGGVLFDKGKTQLIQYPIGRTDLSYAIPDSVTSIGNYAFAGCTSLTTVTIPISVTSIGDFAFDECTSLTQVIIPDSVTSIGMYAFSMCKSLTSVIIGNGVTTIDSHAFFKCTLLTTLTIPGSVTNIGGLAFAECTSLAIMTIRDGVAFDGVFALSFGTADNTATCYVYGCSDKGMDPYKNGYTTLIYNKFFTVTFDSSGGSSVQSQSVQVGSAVAKPADPTRDNYVFVGWYNGEEVYDFSTPVTSDVTLTAHWAEVSTPIDLNLIKNIAAAIVLTVIGIMLLIAVFYPWNRD